MIKKIGASVKIYYFKSISYIQSKDYLKVFLVFSMLFFLFTLIYLFVDRFASLDDHFFHIRFAELIKTRGLNAFKDFHWLYFSKISINQRYFIYYNFLFYLILIPFTFIKPLFLGIKFYAVFFASASFTTLYYLFLKTKEKSPLLWVIAILAITNYGSIWRFFLTRPYALAPALLILELYLLYKKKYAGIFVLSFIYLYWHSVTFFFPLFVAIIYFAFDAFYNKNKFDWKIIASSLSGTILALATLNFFAPGFFSFIKDIYFGMFRDTLLGKRINIAEGGELYPADFINFIRTNTLTVALLMIAVVFEILRYVRERKNHFFENDKLEINKRPLKGTLFFLSIGFLLGTFLSQRNGDFFVFFSAAYIVLSFNHFFQYVQINNGLVRKSLYVGIVITVIYLFTANLLFIHSQIASSGPYDSIEGASNWLEKNTIKGEIVFNASWNWFPILFYYNTHNYYIAGIEPRFLYDYNPKMYWVWRNISSYGYLCFEQQCNSLSSAREYAMRKDDRKKDWYENQGNQVADTIKNMFKSQYIITSKDTVNFNDLMNNSDRFQKVYTDNIYNQYFVYKIVE